MQPLSDKKIIDSWLRNAEPWTMAVRASHIESRRLLTDAAIIDAVAGGHPRTVIDIGCGEGWLAHRLEQRGMQVLGIDAVPALIARARPRSAMCSRRSPGC